MKLAILAVALLVGCATHSEPPPAPTGTLPYLSTFNPPPHPLPPLMDCLTRRDGVTTRAECR